jgi:hypothetical protein
MRQLLRPYITLQTPQKGIRQTQWAREKVSVSVCDFLPQNAHIARIMGA